MMTFKELKKLVDLPAYKEARVPTVKALEESDVPVVAEKILENHGSISVYQNGYVIYRAHKRVTVFSLRNCVHYKYDALEGAGHHIKEEEFDEYEWHIRLVLEGEDRIFMNYEIIQGKWMPSREDREYREEILEGVDEAVSTLERMISEERVEELLSTLTDLQRKVVHTHLFHGLSFTEAAKHLGMTRQNLTGIYNAAIYKIFRCGRTLPFAIEALQRTFYPLGIQFAVVEDDFCSADKTAEEVAEYFNGKTIDKIRSEFITNRQNHFEEGTLTHRQAKYGYALSEDRRNLVLNPESAQVVKLIFQMYLEDMKIPEIARALDAQGVPSPQIQMAKKKRSRAKIKWPDSTIRSILKNPLYIGKCTLTLAKAKRELEVPAIVSETEFQKAQKKLESTRLPSRKKARKKPNLLFKKIYDKESGKGLLCRTSEDESQQIYSFDKGYRCFSGKAPFIESEKIFREILSALEKEKMQAARIDRVLDLNPEKVKQCMDAGLLQYRKRANEIVEHLMAKDDERTAVYRKYEQGLISLEQVEEYEHQYQVAVQKQETAFKKVMLAVNDIEKAFSHGNPWLMKFRAISIPETLERAHLKEWLDHVWIVDFEQVEVILQESEWKRFFPEEWLNNGEEDCNGKKE